MVAAAVEQFGRVDILVYGAGVGIHKEIVDLTDDEWDLQVDVQLRGAFLLSRAVGRRPIAQGDGGRIILIGSTAGNNARPKSGPHAASKAARLQDRPLPGTNVSPPPIPVSGFRLPPITHYVPSPSRSAGRRR